LNIDEKFRKTYKNESMQEIYLMVFIHQVLSAFLLHEYGKLN